MESNKVTIASRIVGLEVVAVEFDLFMIRPWLHQILTSIPVRRLHQLTMRYRLSMGDEE